MKGEEEESNVFGPSGPMAKGSDERTLYRIRDIKGIRIHQLTLPQSLKLASKLVMETAATTPGLDGYSLGEPSRLSSSPETSSTLASQAGPGSRRARRESTSTLRPLDRSPSISASPISPVGSTFRQRSRHGRSRSQTLAGEALDHGVAGLDTTVPVEEEPGFTTKPLARSFIVLRLPKTPIAPKSPSDPSLRRSDSARSSLRIQVNMHEPQPRPAGRRLGSSDGVDQSLNGTASRPRLSSLPSSPDAHSNKLPFMASQSPLSSPRLHASSRGRRTSSPPSSPGSTSGHNLVDGTEPRLVRRSDSGQLGLPSSPRMGSLRRTQSTAHLTPFYISPIHRPSIYPRFLSLSLEDDFGSWLGTEDAALSSFEIEVWYEDVEEGAKWRRLDNLCQSVHMDRLRKRGSSDAALPNTVEFVLGHHQKAVYYLDPGEEQDSREDPLLDPSRRRIHKSSESRALRPRQGLSVGGLLELINLQNVLVETEREINRVQSTIDTMLQQDADWAAIRRDVKERESRCAWLQKAIAHVDKTTRETQAHITLHDQANEKRRSELCHAEEQANLVQGHCEEHRQSLDSVETERMETIPQIHHYRMYHAQCLDSLFPIQLLHPPSLLYTILDIPLPIPSGPKEPAPPLNVPATSLPSGYKVDERTNAAALGYAALVVQLLGHFGGATSGLPYPITCAGSRSLVKDVISIMQGLRSFPLYTKGVERYRYEYAVHMLNQNLEMLMQEANIRPLDVRQTLPNLKVLLLTLSSPASTSQQSLASLGSRTAITSRTSSRQTSYTFERAGYGSPGSSINGRESPMSSRLTTTSHLSPLSRGHERKSSLRPIKIVSRHLDGDMEEQLRDANRESDDEEKSTSDDTIRSIARHIVNA